MAKLAGLLYFVPSTNDAAMDHISGLGGAFVFSDDPARLAQWYTDHLGLTFEGGGDAYYQTFWSVSEQDLALRLDTTFSIIRSERPFRQPAPESEPPMMYGDQVFMVNLRTPDLEALLAHLEARGVRPIQRVDEPYGRFAWIRDADGYRVELYEPLLAAGS
jgi:glyoxylase I family protein